VARDCFPVNRDVMRNPKVRITVGDGREALLVSRERYDLIFSEPSNPFRAGIASLFTKEYYEAALDRLSDDGLFLQWVQAYEIDPRTVRTIYATLSSVFPSVSAWQVSSGASSARRLPTSGPVRRRWRPSETHGGARIGGDTRATLDA